MWHGIHSGSVPTLTLVVLKLIKTLISANMCGIRPTGVIDGFLKRKVVVRTQELCFGIKVCITTCLYNCMLLKLCMVHSGSVATRMLAVFKLVKTLSSADTHGMQSSYVVHRFLKLKVEVSTQERSLGIKGMH